MACTTILLRSSADQATCPAADLASGVGPPAPPRFYGCHIRPRASRSPLEIVAPALGAVVGTDGDGDRDLAPPMAREGSQEPHVAIGHDGLPATRGPAPRRPRRRAWAP